MVMYSTKTLANGMLFVINGYLAKDDLYSVGFRYQAAGKVEPVAGWLGKLSEACYRVKGVEWPKAGECAANPVNNAPSACNDLPAAIVRPSKPCRIPTDKISTYQKAVETHFLNESENIVVSALAGTGKTTLLKHLASFQKEGERWLYLIFNSANQKEALQSFPSTVDVMTSHSFLGKVISHNSKNGIIENTQIWPEKGTLRTTSIIDKLFEDTVKFPFTIKYTCIRIISQITSLAKNFAINPKDEKEAIKIIENIISQYGIESDYMDKISNPKFSEVKPDIIEGVLSVLHYCIPGNSLYYKFDGFRDHDDTVWYPTLFEMQFPKYQIVLVDEVQDFNKCQIIMLENLAKAGARIIAVGDKNQAMYGFRGADSEAFDNVKKTVGGNLFDLPTNYRSGKNIIEYVKTNTVVKTIEAGMQFEGIVKQNYLNSESLPIEMGIEYKKNDKNLKMETAVIASINAILAKVAVKLMYQNVDFLLVGKDMSKEFVDLVGEVVGFGRKANHCDLRDFSERLAKYLQEKHKRFDGLQARKEYLTELDLKVEAMTSILEYIADCNYTDCGINVGNTQYLIMYLQKKFAGVNLEQETENTKQVILTTAHKSKGLEFARVFILAPELAKADDNLWYVACTRAKKELNICEEEKRNR